VGQYEVEVTNFSANF